MKRTHDTTQTPYLQRTRKLHPRGNIGMVFISRMNTSMLDTHQKFSKLASVSVFLGLKVATQVGKSGICSNLMSVPGSQLTTLGKIRRLNDFKILLT